jgi:hypothetical protein
MVDLPCNWDLFIRLKIITLTETKINKLVTSGFVYNVNNAKLSDGSTRTKYFKHTEVCYVITLNEYYLHIYTCKKRDTEALISPMAIHYVCYKIIN